MSKGEDKVASLLKSKGISFIREYSFSDLRYKGHFLRFDFMIIEDNIPKVAVEVDGKQHFQYIPKFGTYSDFKHMQENDRRKNSYCLAKSIPLIRIPYWDIEALTFEKIFNTSSYLVKSKFHNDLLSSSS